MRVYADVRAHQQARVATALSALGHTVVGETDADVVCFDEASRAITFAKDHPDHPVLLIGEQDPALVKAGIYDILPVDGPLEGALDMALSRLARTRPSASASVEQMLNMAPDGVAITTDDVVTFTNQRLAALLMDSQHELLGRLGSSLVHPDSLDAFRADQEYVLTSGEPTQPAELRLLRSDGSARVVEMAGMPFTYGGEPSVLWSVRNRDETHTLKEQLVIADRMAAVGTLAAGIAHELNNPLAYLLTNLQLCREDLRRGDSNAVALLEHLDVAVDGAHRMSDIVRDLKTFSRDASGRVEAVDVSAALHTAIHMCENEIRHRGELKRSLDEMPDVEINPSRLCQVFVNLLINAAHAIGEVAEGVIEIIAGTDDRGWASIRIEDNGPGIRPGDMARIFEPFFTTKASPEGTGLGLLICRNIVTQAGGELHVESSPGDGARFTVFFPPCESMEREVRPSSIPPKASSSARVLVVDDEQLIGRALERALREHEVTVTTSGTEALDLLSAQTFDVIFCDLMMPVLSGMELFERATAADEHLSNRFVFMTGGAFTPSAKNFLENSGCEVIDKPFDLKQLRAIAARSVAAP